MRNGMTERSLVAVVDDDESVRESLPVFVVDDDLSVRESLSC
jgi:FixJ family two-component response regulator